MECVNSTVFQEEHDTVVQSDEHSKNSPKVLKREVCLETVFVFQWKMKILVWGLDIRVCFFVVTKSISPTRMYFINITVYFCGVPTLFVQVLGPVSTPRTVTIATACVVCCLLEC